MSSQLIPHLLEEHRRTESILAELESLLDAHKSVAGWTKAHSETFARILLFFGTDLACHIRKEEEVLFPFLHGFLPRDSGPLTVLHGEHEELCRNFTSLCRAGQSLSEQHHPAELLETLERYGRAAIQLMRDHIYKEDRVLFPLVGAMLSPEQDQQLFLRMGMICAWKEEPDQSAGPAKG